MLTLSDRRGAIRVVDLRVLNHDQWSGQDMRTQVMLRYPGRATHPAAQAAPVSWFNDDGRGLIRVIDDEIGWVVLPLLGKRLPDHAPLWRDRPAPGPLHSSDLWLLVAALCLEPPFASADLERMTGISRLTIRRWIRHWSERRIIEHGGESLNSLVRTTHYRFAPGIGNVINAFMLEQWPMWRSGRGHPVFRPKIIRCVSSAPWETVAKVMKPSVGPCFATGLTVLERDHGDQGRRWIQTAQGLTSGEFHCYVTKEGLSTLLALPMTVVEPGMFATGPISTICVVSQRHPAMRLHAQRIHANATNPRETNFIISSPWDEGLFPRPWPYGIAALDAIDHPDRRVRDAAADAWRWWLHRRLGENGI
jgi:hypothetical protein